MEMFHEGSLGSGGAELRPANGLAAAGVQEEPGGADQDAGAGMSGM